MININTIPVINRTYNMTVYCCDEMIKNENARPENDIVNMLSEMSKASIVEFLSKSEMANAFISEGDPSCKRINREMLLIKIGYMLGNRIGCLHLAWENEVGDSKRAWKKIREIEMK